MNNQPEKQNEPINFDEEFDARVLILDPALRRLSDTLRSKDEKQSNTIVDRFVVVLL